VLVFGVPGIEGAWHRPERGVGGAGNERDVAIVHRQWSLVLRDGEDWIQLGTG